MKSTGMIRKVDELGRIVLPIEIRRSLSIEEKDSLEIFVEDDNIVLRKKNDSCVFCGSSRFIVPFGSRYVCSDCLEKLHKLV